VKFINAFGLVPVFVLSATAYGSGCSSGSTGTGSGGVSPPSGSSSGTVNGNQPSGTGSSGGASGDAGPNDQTCAAQTTNQTCQQCCAQVHTAGYQTFANALLQCACGTTGGCASACAMSACASSPSAPSPGDACDTCISQDVLPAGDAGTTPCDQPIVNACGADPNCGAFALCARACVAKM
jgi:hypothetical protein